MEMMTIAQRKAAKLNKIQSDSTNSVSIEPKSIQNMTVDEASKLIAVEATVNLPVTAQEIIVNRPVHTPTPPVSASQPALSASEILELAAKHGLKLQAPKKEFVKHTYSVTTESKALFKKYCDVLGLNMQDAMEEALQMFFKKNALEYSRVKEAKNK